MPFRKAKPIDGRVVAITGGARGIGAAIATALARAGARVAIGDLDREGALELAHSLGSNAVGLPLDVTDTESFATFLETTERELGPLDVLINNAGVMWVGPFAEEPEEVALAQFDVNFHGAARGMKLAIPAMRRRGRGHVVNIASAASRVGPAGEATYAASKHAIYGFSEAVRAELRGSGVKISLVMPAVVETELALGTASGTTSRLHPEEVAEAVVGLLRHPRFTIFVPRSIDILDRISVLLPRRARDVLHAVVVPDQVRSTDQAARSEYERDALR
jgi:NAD(P)-dependent dehydrogenase (short-subunit alcohol dehydrogenase family)